MMNRKQRSIFTGIRIICLLLLGSVGIDAARLAESFDYGFPPEGWIRYDLDSGYCGWNRDTTIVRSAPGSARCGSENSGIRNNCWLITPRLLVAPGDWLSFAYRPHGVANEPFRESLEVRVSVAGIRPEEFTDCIWAKGFQQTAWESASISLAAYAGESIHIAFRQCGINSYSTWLDNVRGPEVWLPDTDVAVRAIRYPGPFAAPGDTVRMQFVLKNCGAQPVGVVPVSYLIRDSLSGSIVHQGTEYAPPLLPGDTLRMTATDCWLAGAGSYSVTVESHCPGDKNTSNDRSAAKLRVSWTQEQAFDDGLPAYAIKWSAQGFGAGVRFKPGAYPAQLTRVGFGLNPDWEPAPGGDSVNIWLLRAQRDGTPGALLAETNNVAVHRGGWNWIGLGPRNIRIDSGSIFVFVLQPRPSLIGWNLDMKDDAPESTQWVRTGGVYYPKRALSQMPPGDFLIRSELRRIRNDVGTVAILALQDTVLEGVNIIPAAVVGNFGEDWVRSVPVVFRIGTAYESRVQIESIAPGGSDTVRFAGWTSQRGHYVVSCSTELASDVRSSNDCRTARLFVLYRDVAVQRIISPPAQLLRGETIVPTVVFGNPGSTDEYFMAQIVITRNSAVSYAESLQLYLTAGESLEQEFSCWNAESVGEYTLTAAVRASGDMNPVNDTLCGAFRVDNYDVGVTEILSPRDTVLWRSVVIPRAQVANFGTNAVTFTTQLQFQRQEQVTYVDSVGQRLLPGETLNIVFSPWRAESIGEYLVRVITLLAGDQQPGNDTAINSCYVCPDLSHDVGVEAILSPQGGIDTGTVVTPTVIVRNWGNHPESFPVIVMITDPVGGVTVLSSFVSDSLMPGQSDTVVFNHYTVRLTGDYALRCSTSLGPDANPSNDTITIHFYGQLPSNWQRLVDMPAGVRARNIKAGSALAAAEDVIYALKGNRTHEFYAYYPNGDSWHCCAPIPGKGGVESGAGCCYSPAGRIYAVKGGNSEEFWAYVPANDSWYQVTGIPGPEKIKAGSCIALLDAQSIYLLKGGNSREFWKYLPDEDRWQRCADAPAGRSYRPGTCLATARDYLYLVRGFDNQLFAYSSKEDTWYLRNAVPRTGRGKRAKTGTSITSQGDDLWLLKGARSGELWHYCTFGDTWTGYEALPRGTAGRRVAAGGAIVSCNHRLYALKGNNTREFWCYSLKRKAPMIVTEPPIIGQPIELALSGYPNPSIGIGQIDYWLPAAKDCQLALYDATGRRLPISANRWSGSIRLRLEAKGIYFLQLSTDQAVIRWKVICQ